jgi:hypothetical protein
MCWYCMASIHRWGITISHCLNRPTIQCWCETCLLNYVTTNTWRSTLWICTIAPCLGIVWIDIEAECLCVFWLVMSRSAQMIKQTAHLDELISDRENAGLISPFFTPYLYIHSLFCICFVDIWAQSNSCSIIWRYSIRAALVFVSTLTMVLVLSI